MIGKNERKYVRIGNRPVYILDIVFIAFLLVAICVLSFMLYRILRTKEISQTPEQDLPEILIPSVVPADQYFTFLPNISSRSISVQIWIVKKINSLGYRSGGQRSDVAVFARSDGQEKAKGYCINRGWNVPDIGTEYLLDAEGIFIPLTQSDAHPIQRFMRFQ